MNRERGRGPGRLITFEGGEGAGKSTQVRALAARLGADGIPVTVTREPGGSPGAEAIRSLLLGAGGDEGWDGLTEALLVNAARRDHLERRIKPALAAGEWVLCDRFVDSTRAYQGAGGGVDPADLATLDRLVGGGLRPDLTLILDLPVPIGRARAVARGSGGDRFERRGEAFHEKVRAGFLAIAAAEPERCVVIDAVQAAETVTAAIVAVVETRLALCPRQTELE